MLYKFIGDLFMVQEDIYKLEAFDLVQLLFNKDHDHMMHGVIKLNGHIREKILKEAIRESTKDLPMILCKLERRARKEYWKTIATSIEDVVKVIYCDLHEEQVMKAVTKAIDTYNAPQLCVTVLRGRKDDILCIVMNHMLCDGVGFKNYLYLLCSLYNNLISGKHVELRYNANSRNLDSLFDDMSGKIKTKKISLSTNKENIMVSLEGDESRPFILTEKISKEDFLLIKNYSREQEVTINDIFMSVYMLTLRNVLNLPISKMKCTVDIRKYLQNKKSDGLSNLTSFLECNISKNEKMNFHDILREVSASMKKQKESSDCLKVILYLHRAYKYLPYAVLKKVINVVLKNPAIAFTNIGILEKTLLNFDGMTVNEAFITGSIKHVPNFQLAVSTFDNEATFSINLYGSTNDEKKIQNFLKMLKLELMKSVKCNC